jgi:hypothetical protein
VVCQDFSLVRLEWLGDKSDKEFESGMIEISLMLLSTPNIEDIYLSSAVGI